MMLLCLLYNAAPLHCWLIVLLSKKSALLYLWEESFFLKREHNELWLSWRKVTLKRASDIKDYFLIEKPAGIHACEQEWCSALENHTNLTAALIILQIRLRQAVQIGLENILCDLRMNFSLMNIYRMKLTHKWRFCHYLLIVRTFVAPVQLQGEILKNIMAAFSI